MGKVTRAEWKWVWGFAAVLTAVLLLPYVIGFSAQGADWRFGGNLFGISDGYSYLAKMRQGMEGAWFYKLAYTTEPQTGALIFLPYLALGKLAGGADLFTQLAVLYHLARIAAGLGMIFAAYRFLACFLESVPLRKFGLLLAALGGGFGGLLALLGVTPLEFYSPETFGFLALFGPPHLAAARALLLMALTLAVDPTAFGSTPRRAGWWIGGILLLAWLFQPLDAPIAWGVMGMYALLQFVRARGWKNPGHGADWMPHASRTATAILVSAPAVLYSFLAFNLDPVLRQWTAQNIISSPAVWVYLAGYGVLLIPALAGIWRARAEERILLPAGWLILLPAFIYFPMNLQRRLADGSWMAFIILGMISLEGIRRPAVRRALMAGIAVLALPAALFFYAGATAQAVHPAPPAFLPAAEIRAMEWLDAYTGDDAIVLTRFDTGNALPAFTNLHPYIGHGPETLYHAEKTAEVELVLDAGAPAAERQTALRRTGARFVLAETGRGLGDSNQNLGCGIIYRAEGWEICEVGVGMLLEPAPAE
jgi:hypothetical protein